MTISISITLNSVFTTDLVSVLKYHKINDICYCSRFHKSINGKNNLYDVNIVQICTLQVKKLIYSDRNGSSVILQFARLIVKNINVDLDI